MDLLELRLFQILEQRLLLVFQELRLPTKTRQFYVEFSDYRFVKKGGFGCEPSWLSVIQVGGLRISLLDLA